MGLLNINGKYFKKKIISYSISCLEQWHVKKKAIVIETHSQFLKYITKDSHIWIMDINGRSKPLNFSIRTKRLEKTGA